jgi:hypothetical protein
MRKQTSEAARAAKRAERPEPLPFESESSQPSATNQPSPKAPQRKQDPLPTVYRSKRTRLEGMPKLRLKSPVLRSRKPLPLDGKPVPQKRRTAKKNSNTENDLSYIPRITLEDLGDCPESTYQPPDSSPEQHTLPPTVDAKPSPEDIAPAIAEAIANVTTRQKKRSVVVEESDDDAANGREAA